MKPDKALVVTSIQALRRSRQQAIFQLKDIRQRRLRIRQTLKSALKASEAEETETKTRLEELGRKINWEVKTHAALLRS